ncbi:hypothetical protein ACW9UR_02495 [Halovulum sp. GXIMD14794]
MSDSDTLPEQDDDLLSTIRALVSEEAARAEPVRPKTADDPFSRQDAGAVERAPDSASVTPLRLTTDEAPPAARAGAAPLILDQPVKRGRVPTAPMYDEDALRGIVTELVRDELEQMMGEELDMRLRKAVRREIARLAEQRAQRRET